MYFTQGILIFQLIGLGLISVSETAVQQLSTINVVVGQTANFTWSTTNNGKILTVIWGIRSGGVADPQYMSVDDSEVPVYNPALDPELRKRVKYIGNLTAGRAWFALTSVNFSDSNTYIAQIREDFPGSSPQPYYVELDVKEAQTSAPPTTPRNISFQNTTKQPGTVTTITTTPVTTVTTTTESDKKALELGFIIGVVIGVILGILLAVFIVCFCCFPELLIKCYNCFCFCPCCPKISSNLSGDAEENSPGQSGGIQKPKSSEPAIEMKNETLNDEE